MAVASNSRQAPEARAISSPWPRRPNPVTSVALRTPAATSTSAAARLSRRIDAMEASRSDGDVRPCRAPDTMSPVPSGFVSSSVSPGRAPPLRRSRSGWATPTTASPNFGSRSRIVWPPASVPPASRTTCAAPPTIAAMTSVGRSSGKAAIESAKSTRPPMAKTSEQAFAAAIAPKVAGSSTSGGKKSTVPITARSSESR